MSIDDGQAKPEARLPALRAVDVVPFRNAEGETHYALRDRMGIATNSVALSPAGIFVLAHLDGTNSCSDIQTAFLQQTGMVLPAKEVLRLVSVLDDLLLLQGDRFEAAYAAARAQYAAADARDNRERYPDAASLQREIEDVLSHGVVTPGGPVLGLIAPHLDYARGAPCYADAYATLAASPPADRYVILGTNHAGRAADYVATRKDFQTPLGRVAVDRSFLAELQRRVGRDLCAEELDHFNEHSIELQVHVLQVLNADHPFEIVPVLCPSPCDGPESDSGCAAETRARAFAEALGQVTGAAAGRTVLIAGADLSHVGQRFGDTEPTTPAFLSAIGAGDRELLRLVEERREEELVSKLRVSENPTRICSAGCIYTLLRALPGRPCRLLSYHQAVDMPAETHVTCAALVVT